MARLRRFLSHTAVKAGYLILLLAIAAWYLVRWGDRLPDLVGEIRPVWVGAAFVLACLSSLLYSYIQYHLFHRLGARPTYRAVFRIVTLSQLGKYVPGKVLFAGNYYIFSREAGIENLQIGAAFAITMTLWLLTASLCSLLVLGVVEPALRYAILILPLLLAFLIHPRFLGWLLRAVQRTARRVSRSTADDGTDGSTDLTALLAGLGAAVYLRLALLYLATWALTGLGTYLCLVALAPQGFQIFPVVMGSIALGTIAGFVALFAPVGLGVREGMGVLILSPAVGAGVALLGMVLFRGVTVAADLLLALIAVWLGRRAAPATGLETERRP